MYYEGRTDNNNSPDISQGSSRWRKAIVSTYYTSSLITYAKKKSENDSDDPPDKKSVKRSKITSSSSTPEKAPQKLSKSKTTPSEPIDSSIDSEEIDMDELRSILDKVTAVKAGADLKQAPPVPGPTKAGVPVPSRSKMTAPKRGRPSTKFFTPEIDSEQSDVSNIISEEELQEALRVMESSEDFNFNLDMDDFLDEDAQLDLEGDLDVPDSEDFLRTVSSNSNDPLAGLRVPKADKMGVSTKIDGKVGIDDLDDDDLDHEEEEELADEDDDYLAALDRRRDLLVDDEDLLLDDVIGSKQLAVLEVDEDDDEDDEEEDEDDLDDDVAPTSWGKNRRPTKISKSDTALAAEFNEEKKSTKGKRAAEPDALIVDGVELKGEDFDLGIDPPPLEEFKRLMESLADTASSMFEDEGFFSADEEPSLTRYGEPMPTNRAASSKVRKTTSRTPMNATQVQYSDSVAAMEEDDTDDFDVESDLDAFRSEDIPLTPIEKNWYPNVYRGGETELDHVEEFPESQEFLTAHDSPAAWRVKVVSVVTNSSRNSTALDYVKRVYDHIKAGTENDTRIQYQTLCLLQEDEQPFEELEDMVQMWVESYNTYHLVDGAAMKEAWGAIMPHIMLSEKNLQAILAQVKLALDEDQFGGTILTPRLRRVRFRGGAQEMSSGFNTEFLDSEFSVVSVR